MKYLIETGNCLEMGTFSKAVLNETFTWQKESREYYFLCQNTMTKTKVNRGCLRKHSGL